MQPSRLALLVLSATLATPSALAQLASIDPARKPASDPRTDAAEPLRATPADPTGPAAAAASPAKPRADSELLPTLDDPISTSESSEGIVFETRPGGWQYAYLRGRFTHFMMRRLRADGTSSLICSDHTEAGKPPTAEPGAGAGNWHEK